MSGAHLTPGPQRLTMTHMTPPDEAGEIRSIKLDFRLTPRERAEAIVAARLEDRPLADFARLAVRDRVRAAKKRHPEAFRDTKA